MNDKSKTKTQLIEDIIELRQRVAELEGTTSETSPLAQDISQTIIQLLINEAQ